MSLTSLSLPLGAVYSPGGKEEAPRLRRGWYELGLRGQQVNSEDAIKAYKAVVR